MTVRQDDRPRGAARRRSRARVRPARVVGPLVISSLVQVAAIVAALVIGLPWLAIVLILAGIAVVAATMAWRTVTSLVAGAGIRVAQPYSPGEQIRVFVPALDSVEDAEIVRVGPANTTIMTASGIVLVPNAQMLRSTARST